MNDGDKHSTYIIGLLQEFNDIMQVKTLAQCLSQRKCLVNVSPLYKNNRSVSILQDSSFPKRIIFNHALYLPIFNFCKSGTSSKPTAYMPYFLCLTPNYNPSNPYPHFNLGFAHESFLSRPRPQ